MRTETPKEAAARAIAILGGPSKTATLLQIRFRQSVEAWRKSRVPAEYCPLVEKHTAAVGKPVRCEVLRPDIEWSVLREPAKAA